MEIQKSEDVIVIKLAGRVDYNSCDTLRKEFLALADEQKDVAIDLSEVIFMDSSGLGLLVSMRKKVNGNNKKLSLIHLNPEVEKVLRVTRLLQTFDVR